MSTSNGTVTKTKVVAKAKTTPIKVVKSVIKSQGEIIKRRMDKRTKLSTLYKDIDALEKAQGDFDSIQSYGDIRIMVYSGQTPTFTTTRQDSVEAVLKTIQTNISQKLTKAQKELADFEF